MAEDDPRVPLPSRPSSRVSIPLDEAGNVDDDDDNDHRER
jgi:hypothetical protein